MIALADAPIDASAQAAMFSLWTPELQRLREHLRAHYVTIGEVQHPDHAPNGQFRIEDTDDYVLWARQTGKTPKTLQQ